MLEENLIKAKTIIEDKLVPRYLDEYFLRLYSFSNENLSGYLKNNSYCEKSALTVGSSGDQLLNLINYQCRDITVLDINPFTEYYYELKKAAIFALNRNEFLNFFTTNNSFLKTTNHLFKYSTYKKISHYLSQEAKLFWDTIFTTYDPKNVKEKLFMPGEIAKKKLILNNDYLANDNFKELRRKIEKANIIFKTDEIKNRKQTYSKYDYIILSNVFDYIFNINVKTEPEILEVLKTDYLVLLYDLATLLNPDGKMYFQYLWDSTNIENFYYYLFEDVFKNSPNISGIDIYSSEHLSNQIDSVYIYKKIRSKPTA